MKIQIGIAQVSKVVELETERPEEFKEMIGEKLLETEAILWVEDTKKRMVGIPIDRIAYIEIESEEAGSQVGFSA